MPAVIFLTVKDNHSKISRVCSVVDHLFQQNRKSVIAVPNVEVAKYIDTMLWKFPLNSFTPHVVSNGGSDETIVITTGKDPFKGYGTLINLSPDLHENMHHFETIYELYDASHPLKEEASKEKIERYRAKNCTPHID